MTLTNDMIQTRCEDRPMTVNCVLDRVVAVATVLAVAGDRRDPAYLTIRLGGLI